MTRGAKLATCPVLEYHVTTCILQVVSCKHFRRKMFGLVATTFCLSTCTYDVRGIYGNLVQGADGFAPLLGVACGNSACFEVAARWSQIAILHGNSTITDAVACRSLCEATSHCEVWSHDESGKCSLMQLPSHPTKARSLGSISSVSSSGAVPCELPYLVFPYGLPNSTSPPVPVPADTSAGPGTIYSGGEGACGRAPLLKVIAAADVVAFGSVQGWWVGAEAGDVESSVTLMDESLCRAHCANHSGCGGYTLSGGICVLRAALECAPRFGRFTAASASELVARSPIGSGLPLGAVNATSDVAAPMVETECATRQCTELISSGTWVRSTFLPESDCRYALFTTAEEVLGALAGRWTFTVGGSNNLVMTHELIKKVEPGVAGTFADADALRELGVPEPLLAHVYRGQRVDSTRVFDFVWERVDASAPNASATVSPTGAYYQSGYSSWRLVHIYSAAYSDFDSSLGCGGADGQLEWRDAQANCLKALFDAAPDYVPSSDLVRITHVEGRFADFQSHVVQAIQDHACAPAEPCPTQRLGAYSVGHASLLPLDLCLRLSLPLLCVCVCVCVQILRRRVGTKRR